MSEMRLGQPKKPLGALSGPQQKYYQTLSSNGDSLNGNSQLGNPQGFRSNEQMMMMPKPASPPPNMDLESIINNSEAYFKN